MSVRTKAGVALTSLAITFSTAGCAQTGPTVENVPDSRVDPSVNSIPQTEISRAPTTTPALSSPSTGPLAGLFNHNVALARKFSDNEATAVEQCMRDRGFASPNTKAVATLNVTVPYNPYGLLSVEEAKERSYDSRSTKAPEDSPHDETPQFTAAMQGTPGHEVGIKLASGAVVTYRSDGCIARARLEVFGADYDRVFYTSSDVAATLLAEVEKSPGVVRAENRWASCMPASSTHKASRGAMYHALQEDGAAAMNGNEKQRAAFVEHEREVAIQDALCQESSALAAHYETEMDRIEQSYLRRYADDIEKYRLMNATAAAWKNS